METFFGSKIDGLLITASWSEELRLRLGLKGASQIWGERPAWYVWLADSPGAHELQLVEAGPAPAGGGLRRALMAVKHYPGPHSPALARLSPRERALLRGPDFDHTHTPSFEGRSALEPGLFGVGILEMTCQAGQDWMLFGLAGLEGGDGGPGPAPGWDLALGPFRALLGLWAFQARHTPQRLQLTSEDGLDRPGSRLLSLSVLFCPDPERPPEAALALLDHQAGQEHLTLLEDRVFSCRHFHPPSNPRALAAVSPDWWGLAQAQYKSELTSTCGCAH